MLARFDVHVTYVIKRHVKTEATNLGINVGEHSIGTMVCPVHLLGPIPGLLRAAPCTLCLYLPFSARHKMGRHTVHDVMAASYTAILLAGEQWDLREKHRNGE